MAVSLTFDVEGCYRSLVKKLTQIADSIMEQFYNDAILGLDAEGREDSEKINSIWDETEQKVIAECKFYANALMQSFGTGNFADKSAESYWSEYSKMGTKNHGYIFNPARKPSSWISGRPKGEYTNIFGETQESTGANSGKNLEGLHIKDKNGDYIHIQPIAPKYSIQNAENWLIRNHQRRVEDRIEEEIKDFLSTEVKNFFVEVQI